MNRPKFSWNGYFSGTSVTTTLGPGQYTSRKSYSSGNIYVLNCLFNSFTSESDGGALYCNSLTCLLVESSSFFSCKTSSDEGGAIFTSNIGGQCVLHKVCGSDCYSTYTGGNSFYQFSYTRSNNVVTGKNYVNYSSISRCVNERSNSHYILCLNYGKICCPSVNLSMNKCQYHSGIYCYPFSDSSSVTCSLSCSTFVDNNPFGYICIYFSTSGAKYEMKSCNVLRNTQGSSSNGIIHIYGITMIEDSCILDNTATNIFWAYSSYPITLSNCTVDKTTRIGTLYIQNTVTKSFILGLNHLSTKNCHSEYDSAGTLTAIPQVSQKTNKLFYYTCNCQNRISDLFSYNFLFMIMFIHSNPFRNFKYDFYCFYK
jgi:hypothetical protein